MLFTDGIMATMDDLAEYESEIRTVASAEAINLETKLRLAQSEVGIELLATSVMPDADIARNAFTLDQVVITDPLRLWHIFHTLAIVFRDAYNRKLNDKYRPKWEEYRELAKSANGQYLTIGVALVWNPLPAPGPPALDGVAGGDLPVTNYFVCTTWVNASGQESASSPIVAKSLAAAQLPRILPASPPAQAIAWYPYASTLYNQRRRQSDTPLSLSSSWTMPASGLISGAATPSGQPPDLVRTLPRTLQRG